MDFTKLQVKLTRCNWMISVWILLLCEGQSQKCPEGLYVHGTEGCRPCNPPKHFIEFGSCHECRTCEHEVAQSCTSTSNAKCSCRPGFDCANPECGRCVKLPHCREGEELKREGNYKFSYFCQPCNNTSYSDTENGTCKPFIKCHSIGLDEVFPGNRTHNAKCGIIPPPGKPEKELQTVQNVFIYGSVFILICLFIPLVFYTWRTKSRASRARYSRKYNPTLTLEAGLLTMSVQETQELAERSSLYNLK
ncbi:tumor necrosis factor receptor superfamily member 18 [Alosa sapidissima]|uniref:tumor necrosis factor receptor superfamily member 18 n=1 Tax=Alosa sapidissima TaxID=34773 RepID=UPI001C08576F|nr:tumor necrosis factor receptor superfamily member 18 [Alosa sapidissima]